MSATRHFLTLLDFSPAELEQLIRRAIELKRGHRAGVDQRIFPGKVLAMIFAKSSTRTRVSFEAGMTPCSCPRRTPSSAGGNR
jgi:ornithine carbamoyltransferase